MATPSRPLEILVDTREKEPLLFPETLRFWSKGKPALLAIRTSKVALPTGDYALKHYEHICLVERKGSVGELCSNLCTKDRTRQFAAFQRLADECRVPYLLLESSLSEIQKSSRYAKNPDLALQHLFRAIRRFGFHVIFGGRLRSVLSRRAAGEFVARLLATHAQEADQGVFA